MVSLPSHRKSKGPEFRPETLEQMERRLHGEVVLRQPVAFFVITTIAIAAIVTGIVLANFGTYARKESLQGYVEPNGGVVKVMGLGSGVIEKVLVNDGDFVKAGQIIAQVRNTN